MLIKVKTVCILDAANIGTIEESTYEWQNAQPGNERAADQHKDK
jgi:hypothetical protein